VVANGPRLGVPFVGIGKFVAIGLNYSDHAKEAGHAIPTEPIVFMKATTCINGPNDDDHPAEELHQARLGNRARHRHRQQGTVRVGGRRAEYVAGYCVVNDVSERAFQLGAPAASGTRARASTPPARSARGSSPPTRSRTADASTCGWT
jgi:2-keto-4-pentenoate hydratase/2-oxohepta-3-ene-1,7-dioic acid hydratase in catechol pathway